MAQRTVNGSPQIFTYSIADLDNFVVVSDDLTSADFPPEGYVADEYADATPVDENEQPLTDYTPASPDIIVEPGTAASFEGSRVKEFLAWVAGLDEAAADWGTDDAAETASVRVAAGNTELASLASANATPKLQFTYSKGDVGRLGTGWRTNRESNLNYKIWSLHSFENKNDYFVIELDADTNPSKQFSSWLYDTDHEVIGAWSRLFRYRRRAMGLYTLQLVFDHELVGGESTVTVAKFTPASLNESRTKTDGIMEQFGTKLGLSKAPGGDFNYNITYSTAETVTYSDYKIKAEDVAKNRARWVYDFDRPRNGGVVDWVKVEPRLYRTAFYELVPSDHITKTFNAKMRWIWAVAPGYWSGGKKAAKVNVAYGWSEGASYGIISAKGLGFAHFDPYKPRDDYTPMTIRKRGSFELQRPAHLAVRPTSFAPTAGNKAFDKAAGNATLYVLSESDWTIKADADWISGFTPEKGSATGPTQVAVTFSYGANDTGRPRTTNITLTNTEGDKITIQVNQGGNRG